MYDAQDDYYYGIYENNTNPFTGNSTYGYNVLSNDNNSGSLSVASTLNAQHLQYGWLTLNANGTFSYTVDQAAVDSLNNGQYATDYFTYTVYNSSDGSSSVATIFLTVSGLTDPNLFTAGNDVKNFNTNITPVWQYQAGSQYDSGAGNDTITLASDQAHADAANFDPSHIFNAGAGYDIINLGGLADNVNGGADDDKFYITARNVAGVDVIDGGAGTLDILDFSQLSLSPSEVLTISSGLFFNSYVIASIGSVTEVSGSGIEKIIGSSGNDIFLASAAADNFEGGLGNDTFKINAVGGLDSYAGGLGTDTLDLSSLSGNSIINLQQPQGGSGTLQIDAFTPINFSGIDNFIGSNGNDTLVDFNFTATSFVGGTGDDTFKLSGVSAGDTADTFTGGAGIDTMMLINTGNAVVADLQNGSVTVNGAVRVTMQDSIENFVSGGGSDTITTNSAINNISAGDGNDMIKIGVANTSGVDTLNGGAGTDTLDLSLASGTTYTSLLSNTVDFGPSAQANLQNIENVTGSNQIDTIIGNNQNNTLLALNGDDMLYGNDGNDTLDGGAGNDILVGGTGDDALQGGAGDHDTAQFSGYSWEYIWSKASDGTITVSNNDGWGSVGPDGTDTLKNIEHIQFADHTYNTSELRLYEGWDYGWF